MSDPGLSPEVEFTEALTSRLLQNAKFHFNLDQEIITITGDKLELCLRKHIGCVAAKGQWLTPASLFLTFVASLVASTFHDAIGIKGNVWEAIFWILCVGSFVWFVIAGFRAYRLDTSIETLIKEIKKLSATLGEQQNKATSEQRIADHHTSELPVE